MRGLHLRPVEPIGRLVDECLERHESSQSVAILGQGSARAAREAGNGAPQAGGHFVDRSDAHEQRHRGCKNTPCPMPVAAWHACLLSGADGSPCATGLAQVRRDRFRNR